MITSEDLNYAKRLRELRRNKGWKQLLAAEKIGLNSQQEYSKLENGKMHYTDEIIKTICQVFKIHISDFKTTTMEEQQKEYKKFQKAIRTKSFDELEASISKRALLTLLVNAERNNLISELESVELKIQALTPPKYDDVPQDKEYKIYVLM